MTPKRCGHMEGKEVISKDEMVAKIRAAVAARKDPDFCILARTDARAVLGFDEALDRALAYQEAGADIIFFEAPRTVEEMRTVGKTLRVPLLANMVERGKTPLLTTQELFEIGYRVAIYPVSSLYIATKAVREFLGRLAKDKTSETSLDYMVDFPTFNRMIHLDEIRALEKSFTE